ncbi:hypothetical protein JVU11DRAFT_177 [Chiua virens]|nr:hypothetical protein JVU11DRAFT_177 [Chiua virens]
MDDSNSELSTQLQPTSVASVLGVKGGLRFRRHGASQKAHVVLKRVEISEDPSYPLGRSHVTYFSLFAQKRIEVKPGKEILLSVASEDGTFTDQAVIFEGDLATLTDSNSDEEEEVEKQIAHDDTFSDPPVAHVIPPKMRRTWTKHEQVSSVVDIFTPPPPTYVEVGVQVQPTWSVSAVQVVPPTPPAQERLLPQTPPLLEELSPPVKDAVPITESHPLPQFIPLPDDLPIPNDERARSLSPMSIGSPSSTPPQSPLRIRSPSPVEAPPTFTDPSTSTPDTSKTPPTASATQQAPVEKPEAPWTNVEDAASRTSQISPVSSETVDMDLQSSPSSESSTSSDEIPGFITGAASRRARAPSPLVLPVAPIKSNVAAQTPVAQSAQTIVASPVSTVATIAAPLTGDSAIEKNGPPPPVVATALKRAPLKNPFVSGGFITEFVGERDSLTTKKDSMDRSSVSDKTPSPVEQPPIKTEPPVSDNLPPPPVTQPLKLLVPENRSRLSLTQSYPPHRPPASFSSPSRPSDPPEGYPSGSSSSAVKSGYQPITSANDPRLTYTSTGSISNPLNIRPSRFPPPAPPKSSARVSPPQSGSKRKVVVGNGWPYNKQTNGHTATTSGPSASPPVARTPLPVIRPLTPESNRSSTTPPGLSGLAPYTSPSPPGFLHSSSGPKSATEQGRFGLFSQSVTSTPQIKNEVNDWPSPSLLQSPVSISAQSIPIQAPRPIAPSSAASSVLQYTPKSHGQVSSNSSTPSHDSKGKKRALTSDADVDAENPRPRKRTLSWPSHDPMCTVHIKSDEDPGINYLAFSSDGERLAVICNDRTIRIWNIPSKVETARLAQNAGIVAVAWMSDDMGVVTLGRDGVISKWTRTNQNHWQWAKLLDAGKEDSICFAYRRDRIAVAFPRMGVKVWIWIKGTWQPQRSILRQNVTSIQFVEDGEALIGGTSDGVLWYCQVPNGTLRAYAFLKAKVHHLDVNGPGTHALVSQAGGRAHLVGIQQTDHKGKIEQVYSTNGDIPGDLRQNVGAVFASNCKTVLFGSTEGNLLVWDKAKGDVVCGLDHGESEQVQSVACYDRGSQACIVTGTKSGLLSWWKPPLMES